MKNTLLFLFLFISLIARGQFDTLYIINLENRDKLDVIGNANAPYFNSQILPFGTEFTNVSHLNSVSFPNYVRLWGGTSHGVSDNTAVAYNKFPAPSLHTVINSNGGLVHTYIQGLTDPGCKHWEHDVNGDEVRSRHRLGYGFQDCDYSKVFTWSQYFTNAKKGTVNILSLTEKCNSHDTNVRTWDECLRTDPVLQDVIRNAKDPSFKTAIFFFTDERDDNPNNLVPTVLMGYGVKKGFKIHTALNHYGFHRLIAKLYNQNGLNTAAGAVEPVGWRDVTTPPPLDTTKCYTIRKDSSKVIDRIDTVFKWNVSTTQVEIPCTTSQTGFIKGMYLNSTGSYVDNPTTRAKVIARLKADGFNTAFQYDISTSNPNFGVFNSELRAAGITPGATFSSISGVDRLTSFNLAQALARRYDVWVSESEPWVTNPIVSWADDENLIRYMNARNETAGVKQVVNYRGWPNANNFIVLVQNSSYGLFHDYQKVPSFGYLKSRFDATNTVAKNNGIAKYNMVVIFSDEPVFMRDWLRAGHTHDEAYQIIKTGFDAQNYSNLTLGGYVVFHYDHYLASKPIPEQFRAVAEPYIIPRQSPEFSDPEFDPNHTDPKHIEISVEK